MAPGLEYTFAIMNACVWFLSSVLILFPAAEGQTDAAAGTQQGVGKDERNCTTTARLGDLSIALGGVAYQDMPSIYTQERHSVQIFANIRNVGDSPVCAKLTAKMETSLKVQEAAVVTIDRQAGGSISELAPRESIHVDFRASIKNGSDPVKLIISQPDPQQGCGDHSQTIAESEVSIPIRVGLSRLGAIPPGATLPPRIVKKIDPDFPEGESEKQPGSVVIRAMVGADGRVHDPEVLRSLGEGFDKKALECVKQWEFDPAVKDGRKVEVPMDIEVSFRGK